MVTKEELNEELGKAETRLTQKINGAVNRLDDELDKRKVIEVRVGRLEKKAA